MFTIEAENVCRALPQGIQLLRDHGEWSSSRAGDVIVLPKPLMTELRQPWQKVLFSPLRNANPYFHLVESVWMLAGDNAVEVLSTMLPRFRQYADGGKVHGAYGRRWLGHWGRGGSGLDQLTAVVDRLRANPLDRQCVISMWDPPADLFGDWHDRPCNTHIYLRCHPIPNFSGSWRLDLTVCCRSNDAVWGAHGANAVHFAVLLEYLAGRLGMTMGHMYQLSNNYHAYRDVFIPLAHKLEALQDNRYPHLRRVGDELPTATPEPIHQDIPQLWPYIHQTILSHETAQDEQSIPESLTTRYGRTAAHAALSWAAFKRRDHESAARLTLGMPYRDWRVACQEWLGRRAYDR